MNRSAIYPKQVTHVEFVCCSNLKLLHDLQTQLNLLARTRAFAEVYTGVIMNFQFHLDIW